MACSIATRAAMTRRSMLRRRLVSCRLDAHIHGGAGVRQRHGDAMSKVAGGGRKSTLHCSFCGKSQHEVRKLVAGPRVFICDECVEISMAIVRGDSPSFYLRTPKEYRKLAADNVRAAEASGLADKALLAVGRTWLRLAGESEKQAG
jgi:hypothetical protein